MAVLTAKMERVKAHSGSPFKAKRRAAWLFSLPAILVYAAFGWYPVILAFVIAFQDFRIRGPIGWVGIRNFATATHDPLVKLTLMNSFYYTFLVIVLTFWVPIIVSILLLEMGPRTQRLMTLLWFIPVSGTASIVIWKFFYNTYYGLFDSILTMLHLPAVRWLDDPHIAMISLVLPGLITYGPGLIYLATLQSVPQELYDAAEIDGAGFLAKVRNITVPTLWPIISVLLILTVIGSVQMFNQAYVMTGGGPMNATYSYVMYIVQQAFEYLDFSYADALALILFIILMVFVIIQLRLQRNASS
ncbi:MAG: sugar ABC transporter permease [Chloroflexi bacterium]|nr:sugar ABC transporter permease [Chloroflexota bacterium]